jgi:hypothetical protein
MNNLMTQMERIERVPLNLIREADMLSKETNIPFRDCLDMVYKASTKSTCRDQKLSILNREDL